MSWGGALDAATASHPVLRAAARSQVGPDGGRAFSLPAALDLWLGLGRAGPIPVEELVGAALLDAVDACASSPLRTALFATLGGSASAAMAQITSDRRWTRSFLQSTAWWEPLALALAPALGSATAGILRRVQAASMWWPASVPGKPEQALEHARQAARVPVPLDPSCAEAWEVNRTGFLGHPELVGDLFGPLVVAASQPGGAGRAVAESAAERRPHGRPVYYRTLGQMPLDTDDAAAVLEAESVHPGALGPALVQRAQQVLRQALRPDGQLDTWVALPGEPPPSPALSEWFGPICPAVSARAFRAAVWSPVERERMRAGLRACITEEGVESPHYTDRVVSTAMVHACVEDPRSRAFLVGAPVGSALAEAERVLALTHRGALCEAMRCDALAVLLRAQRWDGSWPAADWYVCPHPVGELRPFGSATVSSVRARAALARLGPSEAPRAESSAAPR